MPAIVTRRIRYHYDCCLAMLRMLLMPRLIVTLFAIDDMITTAAALWRLLRINGSHD